LKGTTEDWQKILDWTQKLGKYDLKWWTNELEPILEQFIDVSKGDIDKDFWRNMFKYHSQKKYGAPKVIDCWIVKFFPYDKDGKRNNLIPNSTISFTSFPSDSHLMTCRKFRADNYSDL